MGGHVTSNSEDLPRGVDSFVISLWEIQITYETSLNNVESKIMERLGDHGKSDPKNGSPLGYARYNLLRKEILLSIEEDTKKSIVELFKDLSTNQKQDVRNAYMIDFHKKYPSLRNRPACISNLIVL